jgi:hypothetical protein
MTGDSFSKLGVTDFHFIIINKINPSEISTGNSGSYEHIYIKQAYFIHSQLDQQLYLVAE